MKILIVKTSSLGDIIHAYPVLDYLKTLYPDCFIDFVVEKPFAELVVNHPHVRKAIVVNTKQWRKNPSTFLQGVKHLKKELGEVTYDVSFDLQCNLKSGLIVSLVNAKNKVGFGFRTAIEWPNCFFNRTRFNPPKSCNVRDENIFLVKEHFKSEVKILNSPPLDIHDLEQEQIDQILANPVLTKPLVMVCPGSIWQNKQIKKETMIEFLKKVEAHKKCSFLFIWGSAQEKEYATELQANFKQSIIVERLSLSALQNLMGHMGLVIAMDSLPLHLAGTTNTPTFSFFGASSAAKFMPMGEQHQAFQGKCPYGRVIQRRCPVIRTCKTGACLREVSAETLFKAFQGGTADR